MSSGAEGGGGGETSNVDQVCMFPQVMDGILFARVIGKNKKLSKNYAQFL